MKKKNSISLNSSIVSMNRVSFPASKSSPENNEHNRDDDDCADHKDSMIDFKLQLVRHLQSYRSGEFVSLPAAVNISVSET